MFNDCLCPLTNSLNNGYVKKIDCGATKKDTEKVKIARY